jgi:tetratricopeptide (TPR) repeat protein
MKLLNRQLKNGFFAALLLLVAASTTQAAGDGKSAKGLTEKEATMGPVLVGYYREFLESQDLEKFMQNLLARYSESTLIKLTESSDAETRRACAISLGLIGGKESNTAVGKLMQDKDSMVRQFSENALWGIWFRSSSAENNKELAAIRALVSEERTDDAEKRLDALIKKAPEFAEAWNQRAIIHFSRGDFEKSVADCREVIKRNPYHYGAMSGMGQCLIRLNRPAQAQQIFIELLKIQPYNEAIKVTIDSLNRGLT